MRTTVIVLALALSLCLSLVMCTDAGLQENPREEVDFVDNLLNIRGQYCTAPAEEMEFPVKVLIVMDQSASLQCTDNAMLRRQAVQRLVDELRGNPAVSFAYIGFAAEINAYSFMSPDAFVTDVLSQEFTVGPATDYQGALATVVQMMEQDMINSPLSLRARSKYIVLFVSDGVPEPRCDAGCEDDNEPMWHDEEDGPPCSDGRDNDGDGLVDGADDDCADTMPDDLYGVCNTDQEIPEGSYVDMRSLCPEYNQPLQIQRKVDDIMSLADAYGVGEIRMHSIFLFAPQAVVDQFCGGSGAQFGYVRDDAMPLLQGMAEAGQGMFWEVNTAIDGEGSFMRVDYQPLESSFDLMETLSINTNSMPSPDGPIIDTDGDGIADDLEFEESLDRFGQDTDNDGWSDLFEMRNLDAGFEPLNGNRPRECCSGYGMADTCCSAPDVCTCDAPPPSEVELADRDGDGLCAAEERFLGTDERAPDTDGDRLPDGLEFRMNLDATEADSLADHDFDGIRTRVEVGAGTDPQVPDAERESESGVRYRIEDVGEDVTNRHCYDFEVNGLELVATLEMPGIDDEPDPATQGRNRIYLMMVEEPIELAGSRGNLFIGCVEATYLGQTYKDPADGLMDLAVIREACYRSCLTCDIRESVDDCRSRCLAENRGAEQACTACDESCNLFQESEIFLPEVHCVSPLCTDPEVWGTGSFAGNEYFMCLDSCESDGRCNCRCPVDCDCNPYRSERCSTERFCAE